MKTLILYDRNTGDVISTISPVDDDDYAVLVADVSEDRVVARVEDGNVILEDTPEVKEAKERLKKLNEEISKIKLELLENMEG